MKKIVLIGLCFLFLFSGVVFTGCTDKNVLTVATNAEFEPFEFIDKDTDEIVGFDIDLINKIAEKLGMKVELDNMEFDGVVSAVQSGTSKVAISGLTITPKRANSVDFSIPYYSGAAQMIITMQDDTDFTGTTKEELDEQLKGKTIGVCAGFTGKDYVEGDDDLGFAKIEDANATIFDTIALAITALKNGTIDAIIMDDTVAKQAASTDENSDIKVIDVPLTIEEYGIAIKKGDTELKEKIDKALEELKEDGTLDSLLEKWEIE